MKKQTGNGQVSAEQVVVATMGVGYLVRSEMKPNAWADKIDHGSVRVVFYVEQQPVRNKYRILVASRGARPEERQWFNAADIPQAIKCLQEAQKIHKKAIRHLEGGLIRRMFRILF